MPGYAQFAKALLDEAVGQRGAGQKQEDALSGLLLKAEVLRRAANDFEAQAHDMVRKTVELPATKPMSSDADMTLDECLPVSYDEMAGAEVCRLFPLPSDTPEHACYCLALVRALLKVATTRELTSATENWLAGLETGGQALAAVVLEGPTPRRSPACAPVCGGASVTKPQTARNALRSVASGDTDTWAPVRFVEDCSLIVCSFGAPPLPLVPLFYDGGIIFRQPTAQASNGSYLTLGPAGLSLGHERIALVFLVDELTLVARHPSPHGTTTNFTRAAYGRINCTSAESELLYVEVVSIGGGQVALYGSNRPRTVRPLPRPSLLAELSREAAVQPERRGAAFWSHS